MACKQIKLVTNLRCTDVNLKFMLLLFSRMSSHNLYLKVKIQSLLSEVHCLQQLFILAGRVDVLLLHHSVHLFFVLVSDGLEPVKGVKLQVLV